MSENEKKPNKPLRESDNIEQNDLPYDPNINKDDLQALQEKGHSMAPDEDSDKFLAERKRPVDFAGEDLDIPGRQERDVTHDTTDIPDEDNHQFNNRGVRTDEERKSDHPDTDEDITK